VDDQLQLQIARKVLPALPAEVSAWSLTGGSLAIEIDSISDDGLLSARMSSFDAHDEMRLVIPINNSQGGGYDIVCEVAGRFFRSGLEVAVDLSVIRVERRKPFRSEPRARLNELCLLRLTSRLGGIAEFEGKVVDVSSTGIAITTDRALELGDRVEVVSQIGTTALRCTLTALHTEPSAFGRYRTGCRIESVDRAGERIINEHVRVNGLLSGTPDHRRNRPPRAA
jgi:hypothetical protein